MARYIRTDELLATARDGYHSDFGRSMADLTSLREVIEDTPTADVVEVVRCKDCQHYEADIIAGQIGYCNEHQKGMYEQNFCSYGKRKEGE